MNLSPIQQFTSLLTLAVAVFPMFVFADVESSVSTNLATDAHSSLLSVDITKASKNVQFDGDFSSEFASAYAKPQNYDDNHTAKMSLTLLKSVKPALGISAVTSTSEKTTTLGTLGGVTLQTKAAGYTFFWIPSLLLNRTVLKLNSQSTKNQKKTSPYIIQYGTGQVVKIAKNQNDSISFYFNYYAYNRDLAALNNFVRTPNKFLKGKIVAATLNEKLSAYAESLAGFSASYQMLSDLELEAEFYRTTLKKDLSQSDLLTANASYSLTDNTDVTLQGDFVFYTTDSQTLTLSFPRVWSPALTTELGLAYSQSQTEKSWSIVLAINYEAETSKTSTKAETRNQ
jgi:hypothetical protein